MAESKADVAPERAGDETGGPDALARRLLLEAVDCIREASRLLPGDERVSAALTSRADDLDRFVRGLPAPRG